MNSIANGNAREASFEKGIAMGAGVDGNIRKSRNIEIDGIEILEQAAKVYGSVPAAERIARLVNRMHGRGRWRRMLEALPLFDDIVDENVYPAKGCPHAEHGEYEAAWMELAESALLYFAPMEAVAVCAARFELAWLMRRGGCSRIADPAFFAEMAEADDWEYQRDLWNSFVDQFQRTLERDNSVIYRPLEWISHTLQCIEKNGVTGSDVLSGAMMRSGLEKKPRDTAFVCDAWVELNATIRCDHWRAGHFAGMVCAYMIAAKEPHMTAAELGRVIDGMEDGYRFARQAYGKNNAAASD